MSSNKLLKPALREIEIANFRGIDHLQLSFVDPSNNPCQLIVIAGPNGSGKTSVLESCLIAANQQGLISESTPERIRQVQAMPYEITAKFQIGEKQVTTRHFGEERPRSKKIEQSLAPEIEVPCIYFSSWRAPKLVGPLSITAGKKGKRPFHTEDNRLSLVKQYLINAKAHESMQSGGHGRLFDVKSPYRVLIRRLNDVWQLFHPGSTQQFTVEPISDDPSAGFEVFLESTTGPRVQIEALSSGELEVFNFASWMLVENFSNGIILVDEPELHLDPQWHTLIIEALRKLQPDSQFIVATHSPQLYDSAMSFERHLLIPANDPRMRYWHKSVG